MNHPLRYVGAAALSLLLVPAGIAQDPPKPPQPAKPISTPAIRMVAPQAPANPPSQDELKAKRTEKLSKQVFQMAAWHFDYDKARAQAKQDGKLLLVYFTRSYAH